MNLELISHLPHNHMIHFQQNKKGLRICGLRKNAQQVWKKKINNFFRFCLLFAFESCKDILIPIKTFFLLYHGKSLIKQQTSAACNVVILVFCGSAWNLNCWNAVEKFCRFVNNIRKLLEFLLKVLNFQVFCVGMTGCRHIILSVWQVWLRFGYHGSYIQYVIN